MKKPKTSDNDEFSFDFGGENELFPLENSKSDKAAPKGVIGYFKNVVKSVGRLGVQVSKDLYPEVFDFKDQLLADDGQPHTSIKSTVKHIKSEVKKYGSVGIDTFKAVKKDIKNSLKTGNFGGEDEMDMSAFFGGDESFDFGGEDFGSNESESPDASGTKKSKISTNEIVAKSAYATAKSNISMGNRQISAAMGIAQNQIKHENILFSQQVDVFQEQHREQMSVVRNIASNLGKVVNQNNMSNRAQMEFSAKSLAFSQDMAALIKEIRNSQWALTKPAEKKKIEKTEFDKAINGGGYNLKFLKKQLGTAMTSGTLGDVLGMKEGIDTMLSMSDMMGGPGNALKGMVFDGIRKGIENKLISGNTRNKNNADKVSKLPFGLGDKLNNFINSENGIGAIKDKLSLMNVTDNISTMSDR